MAVEPAASRPRGRANLQKVLTHLDQWLKVQCFAVSLNTGVKPVAGEPAARRPRGRENWIDAKDKIRDISALCLAYMAQ